MDELQPCAKWQWGKHCPDHWTRDVIWVCFMCGGDPIQGDDEGYESGETQEEVLLPGDILWDEFN